MKVISICSMNGVELRPWAEAGATCVAIDLQNDGRTEFFAGGGSITFAKADVFMLPDDLCAGATFAYGFPPCTDLACSGARWFAAKGKAAYKRAKRLASRVYKLCAKAESFVIENPVGRLATGWNGESGWRYGAPVETFNPCEFGGWIGGGDAYTKRTCLWGDFASPERRPVFPHEGSKMQRYGGRSMRTKNARSKTPEGWARAMFEANRPTVAA